MTCRNCHTCAGDLPTHACSYLDDPGVREYLIRVCPDGMPDREDTRVCLGWRSAIESAARALVAAMDRTDPAWRTDTLNSGNDGDEVNAAWDRLIAALEGP